ncbi:TolB-like translocation protein [Winogradskyella bathintestinalis]|uniref:Uncharacterized protein n=1 Tax=Winogradskyella bathintestinalis TaxID=3035208 RepID=A0ABT7ZTE8_9FLAO|nr:hypothetical protein [Winogradskyella bathintestinalis]MDN3492247.1 hypothetical protein [Winogradskyella bathintestinalis]
MTKLIFSLCFTISIFSQNNSEIFLFDITANHSKIEIKNGRNISNNNGYDNQPSFIDDQFIVFASSRSEQTDIAKYDSKFHGQIWINSTEGGEYSPLKIPNKSQISAVRLDKDGKQRLYAYNLNEDKSTELIKDLVVAYYTWADENTVVLAVIEDENLNLYTTNIKTGINKKYASNVGRSFHKIPNSDLVSFISKAKENQWQIKSLNPKTGKIKLIANTIAGVEDICWLNNKTLLSGKDNFLYKLRLQRDNDWKIIADVTANEITKITRLSTNTSGTKLLLVGDIKADTVVREPAKDLISEESTQTNANTDEIESAKLVQRHIKAFNHRQLDELVLAFDTDVIVNRFPRAKMYSGRTTLRAH